MVGSRGDRDGERYTGLHLCRRTSQRQEISDVSAS